MSFNYIVEYYKLSPILREQLIVFEEILELEDEDDELEFYEDLIAQIKKSALLLRLRFKINNTEIKQIALHWTFLKKYEIAYLINESYLFKHLRGYNTKDENVKLELIKNVCQDRRGGVIKGLRLKSSKDGVNIIRKDPVIIKWKVDNIQTQIDNYKKMRHINANSIPWFSSSWKLWNEPVLVLEHLENITPEDNEFKIGIDILQQLKVIHKFGVHCDIKPVHILKRVSRDNIRYFLISLQNLATVRHKHGYLRKVWTSKFTSQKSRENDQVTTPYNDLMELGFTLNSLRLSKEGGSFWGYFTSRSIRQNFSKTLSLYINRVEKINCKSINLEDEDYEDLIDILLRDPSLSWITAESVLSSYLIKDILGMIHRYMMN